MLLFFGFLGAIVVVTFLACFSLQEIYTFIIEKERNRIRKLIPMKKYVEVSILGAYCFYRSVNVDMTVEEVMALKEKKPNAVIPLKTKDGCAFVDSSQITSVRESEEPLFSI